MYNRYTPQPDGSYRRSRMQDYSHQQRIEPEQACPDVPPEPPKTVPKPQSGHRGHTQRKDSQDVSTFLKRILPRDFDTGDLLIIVLLLLMAGDCKDDQNTALLTLALYFFM